jgi:hypothetical protein
MIINNSWIMDDGGRRLILRGVNLGGSSKVPFKPNGATHIKENFYNHRDVSFVGRPFPLDRCNEHFERLSKWGFTFLRCVITWEAVEHQGPGQYDNEYLDYLAAVLERAGQFGIKLFIDPHQDVWSRFTGGDGAPGWTLEAAGFAIQNFMKTGAAITHQEYGDPFPWFLWPSNGDRLASATMFTLFFAGNDFAPKTKIEDEPVQEYLQRHYISAMQKVAGQVKGMTHVIGLGTLNETDTGWIGIKDLAKHKTIRKNGPAPTPWQSLLLASGYEQEVEMWKLDRGVKCTGRKCFNSEGVSAWQPGHECIWKENGVWDINSNGQPELLKPDYFSILHGHKVAFSRDYLRPFIKRYITKIREVHPSATIFIDSAPMEDDGSWGPIGENNVIYEPHWYDVATLALKSFKPWLAIDIRNLKMVITSGAVRRSLAGQLKHLKLISKNKLDNIPVLLGEMGIPFNLNDATAYKTGNFSAQEKAIDRCLRAAEDNLMNVTLWNYTADNDNVRGDQWNGEDFSIFSLDQQSNKDDINSGGRALKAILRPYPVATNGEPLDISYDMNKKVFLYKFRHDIETTLPTEIFVPDYQYPQGYRVEVSDGNWSKEDNSQILKYWHSLERKIHQIKISPEGKK